MSAAARESNAPPPPAGAVVSAAPLPVSFVFLGTASMRPSHTRNVSGNALRIGGEWSIVDCGEGTQHQIIKCGVAPGKVNRVFITHLHGDHCFGLPGLLCLLSNNSHVGPPSDDGGESSSAAAEGDSMFGGRVVQIVGPRGLRNMLRMTLLASATQTMFRFRVDELWPWDDNDGDGVMMDSSGNSENSDETEGGASGGLQQQYRHYSSAFAPPRHPCELDGLDVRPASRADGAHWDVPPHPTTSPVKDAWNVRAAPLRHSIMCVGYAFLERPHSGKLDVGSVRDRITTEENRAFQSSRGVKNPLSLLGQLQRGETVQIMEGGRTCSLHPADFLGPPRPGRTVAVLGDTCDSRYMASLALRADLLVHECTNAAVDPDEDENEVITTAATRGHSTPRMAGAFARACEARRLALTHFSSRYKGDDSPEGRETMGVIVSQAREAFGGGDVVAARDLMEVEVPFGGDTGGKHGKEKAQPVAVSGGPNDGVGATRRAADAADFYLRKAGLAIG